MAGGGGLGGQSRAHALGVGRMRAQRYRSVPSQMGCGAFQDCAAGGRGVLVSTGLGLLAPGVGRLLRGRRGRSLRQPHARTAGRQVDGHARGKENQGLALVRGRARIRQRASSAGADPDGSEQRARHATSRPAGNRCAGSCRCRPRRRVASGRSGPRASAGSQQEPEAFDQQPVEAAATISACLAAWRVDRGAEWRTGAMRAFDWFLGENDLRTTLIDPDTGSCSDGLHPDRPNENKGAESALSYLLGLVEIRAVQASCDGDRKRPASQIGARPRRSRDRTREQPQGATLSQSQFSEPPDLASASGSGQGRRQALQAGDRTQRPQPDRQDQGQPHRRQGARARARGCRAATRRSAGEFRRPSQEPARDLRDARRRDGRGVGAACGIEQDATLPDRSIFSARVLVRGVGPVQSEHRPPPRPVRCAGKWLSVHPEPSCRRRRAHLVADVPVGNDRRGWERRRRSDRASGVCPQDRKPDVQSQRRRCRGDLPARRRPERTRHLSDHRRPSQRHRGRPLRPIRRRRTNNVLRDLHGLQRPGDPLRAARNHRFPIVPDDARLPDQRRATKAWLCFRARSMAATR